LVALGPRDPSYVTPLVKNHLNKRNRLRIRGNIEAAKSLAETMNELITEYRSKQFVEFANLNAEELWAAVKGKKWKTSDVNKYKNIFTSPDLNNQFFATTATDEIYDFNEILQSRSSLTPDDYEKIGSISITEAEVESLLRKMKNTSPGNDNIPCWVFKTCSYELAGVIAFIINYSIRSGVVPSTCLTAIVTPVSKVSYQKRFQTSDQYLSPEMGSNLIWVTKLRDLKYTCNL
jgi:hypothetical protein